MNVYRVEGVVREGEGKEKGRRGGLGRDGEGGGITSACMGPSYGGLARHIPRHYSVEAQLRQLHYMANLPPHKRPSLHNKFPLSSKKKKKTLSPSPPQSSRKTHTV